MIRPRALPDRPRVSLVAPAGPLAPGAVDRAIARLDSWGWIPLLGSHARGRSGFLSGTDEERIRDLAEALRSTSNDAIWCLRGGYGTMRILDRLPWGALRERPRPLVGFSDNTALHLAAQREGVVSFHGPHPAAEELPEFSARLLRRLLHSTEALGPLPVPDAADPVALHGGAVEGPLVGGNLSMVAALLGTPFAPPAEGVILFLEEVGEAAYRIDRLLSHLRLAGVLERVAGVALGAFSECPDEGREGMPTPEEVLLDRLGDLGVPVLAGLPFGHVPVSWTLPLGVRARLDADKRRLALLEPAVQ